MRTTVANLPESNQPDSTREKRITIRMKAALHAEVQEILRELGKEVNSTVREFFEAVKRERGTSFIPMKLERKDRDGYLPQS